MYSSLRSASFFCALYLVMPAAFFENRAAIFRPAAQDLVDLALLHDGVGAAADTCVHEEVVDVLQSARRLVEEIFALAVAIHTAGDADLIPIHAEFLLTLRETQRNLRHAERLAAIGAAENDVRHLAATQGFRGLFAKHPAHGIEDIGLAAAIRADDSGDATVEIQDRSGSERFETEHFERLQIHGGSSRRLVANYGWRALPDK